MSVDDDLDFHQSRPADEVVEVIEFSKTDNRRSFYDDNSAADDIELSKGITKQVRQYVSDVASMYKANAFHNFEVRVCLLKCFWK